jgi:hypothetical protein
LWGDATDGFAYLAPAGPVAAGRLRRCVAKSIRQPSECVCISKCRNRLSELSGYTGDGFLPTIFHHLGGNGLWVSHPLTVLGEAECFNYVLTTMC